jgi:hypothetical protein
MLTTDEDHAKYTCPTCRNDLWGPPEMTEYICGICGRVEKLRQYGNSRRALVGALLFIGTFGASYTACDAHAAQSLACDVAALARAEAGAVTAQRLAFETLDPAEGRVAREMVVAAVEQARTARALCSTAEPRAYVAPFEADADPWQTEAPAPLDATDLDATAVVLDLPAKLDALQAELSGMVRP